MKVYLASRPILFMPHLPPLFHGQKGEKSMVSPSCTSKRKVKRTWENASRTSETAATLSANNRHYRSTCATHQPRPRSTTKQTPSLPHCPRTF